MEWNKRKHSQSNENSPIAVSGRISHEASHYASVSTILNSICWRDLLEVVEKFEVRLPWLLLCTFENKGSKGEFVRGTRRQD